MDDMNDRDDIDEDIHNNNNDDNNMDGNNDDDDFESPFMCSASWKIS